MHPQNVADFFYCPPQDRADKLRRPLQPGLQVTLYRKHAFYRICYMDASF